MSWAKFLYTVPKYSSFCRVWQHQGRWGVPTGSVEPGGRARAFQVAPWEELAPPQMSGGRAFGGEGPLHSYPWNVLHVPHGRGAHRHWPYRIRSVDDLWGLREVCFTFFLILLKCQFFLVYSSLIFWELKAWHLFDIQQEFFYRWTYLKGLYL